MDEATQVLEPMPDAEIRDALWGVEPLTEITLQMDGLFDEDEARMPVLEGVVTTVDRAAMADKDSITVEGRSDDLDEDDHGFALHVWYDYDAEEFEPHAVVRSFRYRDNGDRSNTQLGELAAVEIGDEVARDEVLGDD